MTEGDWNALGWLLGTWGVMLLLVSLEEHARAVWARRRALAALYAQNSVITTVMQAAPRSQRHRRSF
jgi:hypothetical protein